MMSATPPATQQTPAKVARHRARLRAAGLRPVQFWVQDTRSPEYVRRLHEQCLSLDADPEEKQVMAFAQTAASLIEGWE